MFLLNHADSPWSPQMSVGNPQMRMGGGGRSTLPSRGGDPRGRPPPTAERRMGKGSPGGRQPTRGGGGERELPAPAGPSHGVKSMGGTYGGMMPRGAPAKENQDNFFVHTR